MTINKNEKKLDLRIQRTLHALQEAFLRLLSEKPLGDITVNELCEGARIRRATFYKHFSGKAEFVDHAIRRMHREFAASAERHRTGESLPSFYMSYAREALRFLRANGALLARMQETNMLPHLFSILTEEAAEDLSLRLEEVAAAGTPLPARREILSRFYIGGLYMTLLSKLTAEDAGTDEEFLAELSDFLKDH